jgi:serine/threonine-protein kinase HipA
MSTRRTKTLDVLVTDKKAGMLTELPTGKYRFEYDDEWQASRGAIPLSYAMPLQQKRHGTRTVSNFLWGLLPDNQAVLDEWAKQFKVSPANPFALLTNIGEDCPGAVQLVSPNQELAGRHNVRWLKPSDLDNRMRLLRADPGAARLIGDKGRFSLAGAQAKTALYKGPNGKWGIPQGRTPTTHIFKPETGSFKGIAANEHFCLSLARAVGLSAAISEVAELGGGPVIIVERFDRRRSNKIFVRRHQEDMCQALNVNPRHKYQADGGPGAPEIMDLLQNSANPSADRDRFMRALALNFIIVGTDAHARNYSIAYAPGGAFRLTPLYDVISFLPYTSDKVDIELAMTIGGEKDTPRITPRHWEALAGLCRFPKDRTLAHISDLVARLPEASTSVASECRAVGLDHPILDALVQKITARCTKLALTFGAVPLTA